MRDKEEKVVAKSICESCKYGRWVSDKAPTGACTAPLGKVPACVMIKYCPIVRGESGIQECEARVSLDEDAVRRGGDITIDSLCRLKRADSS